MDHKDGDHYNNDPENLWTLCPTCHTVKTLAQKSGKGSEESQITGWDFEAHTMTYRPSFRTRQNIATPEDRALARRWALSPARKTAKVD